MPGLATPLRVCEVSDESVRVRRFQPERDQTPPRLRLGHRAGNALSLNRRTRQPRSRRDRAQPAVGIHRDRVTDRFEERDVARGVGVGRRLGEVDALRAGELGDRFRLRAAVEPTAETTRVGAVLDLGGRADAPVEPELGDERVDDLLQCCGHDERALAPLAVPRDEVERVPVDVRQERRVEGLRDDLAHRLHRQALQEGHRALGRPTDPPLPRAVADEDELGDHGLRPVAPAKQPAPVERGRERERARARDQCSIEVEERGARHAGDSTRGR